MIVSLILQPFVNLRAVGTHFAAGLDAIFNKWMEAADRGVLDRALVPFFSLVTNHIARNQTERGFLVSWNKVADVTGV
jgi:hypothetical protein